MPYVWSTKLANEVEKITSALINIHFNESSIHYFWRTTQTLKCLRYTTHNCKA